MREKQREKERKGEKDEGDAVYRSARLFRAARKTQRAVTYVYAFLEGSKRADESYVGAVVSLCVPIARHPQQRSGREWKPGYTRNVIERLGERLLLAG